MPTPQESEATEFEANVTVQNPPMSRMQWIAVVGLGTVLLPPILYWMFSFIGNRQSFIEDKLINTLEKSSVAQTTSATALTATATALNDTTEALGDLKDQQEDLIDDLEPLTKQLGRVANSVAKQIKQAEEADNPDPEVLEEF